MTSALDSYTSHPVEFTGKGGEFFKIWIVNLLLSIVTLGIYSAWAKVRTNQYFYGHTKLNGHSFRYLAKPLQILKGRLLAFAVFALLSVLSSVSPTLWVIGLIALFFAFPWLFIQGMKFNMRMTSYRNVRFSYDASYGRAFLTLIILPIVSVFTLHLALPWVLKKVHQFMLGNIRFGGKEFRVEPSTGQYYLAALLTLGAAILLYIIAIAVVFLFGGSMAALSSLGNVSPEGQIGTGVVSGLIVIMIIFWVGGGIVKAVFTCFVRNHLLSVAEVDGVALFKSNMRPVPYALIQFTNSLLIIVTLGFGYPIARVRNSAYIASATDVIINSEVETLVDKQGEDPSAFGEEAADFFDLDLSLT